MTTTLTYPGVYLSETASAAHTVVPATTNLTAFLGVFSRGPVNEAVLVSSWGEFERIYGPIDANSGMASYCIQQFFLNGGVGAWIVRLDIKEGASASAAAKVSLGAIEVEARNPGKWSESLAAALKYPGGLEPNKTQLELVVTEPKTETKPEVTLERIGGILVPTTGASDAAIAAAAQAAAATITANSRYLKAKPGSGALAEHAAASLAGGKDATWTTAEFAKAVKAALTTSASAPPLDLIAPQVFNIMCIPDSVWCGPAVQGEICGEARNYCKARQAFLLVDPAPPKSWLKAPAVFGSSTVALTIGEVGVQTGERKKLVGSEWGSKFIGAENDAAAVYYPWVEVANPANNDQPILIPPCGTVAGIFAATDTARGVWKAPAGIEAALSGISGLADTTINDTVDGELNVTGINVLRTFPVYGTLVWGSRTLAGADLFGKATKYVPVRRLADFVEQSLVQSLRWAVFEPNGPTLWASLTLEASQFMTGLYHAGAFSGETAKEAFSVVCDASTTSPEDQLNGIVNINVSFQAVDPAEFVVLNLHLGAGVGATS
ncbi:MAG TPA: phage tail sheath C-terminal domain-containing protein [Solirubrobacteraceae bacterium]|nr:phage tail sheath C-terminal domain-containing protein [Solirubrobacteraceae bacterium]